MSELKTVKTEIVLPKGKTSAMNSGLFHAVKTHEDLVKNLDPTRFVDRANETHAVVIMGDFFLNSASNWMIPMFDQDSSREDDVPSYLLKDFRFGSSEANWYQFCKQQDMMFLAFELTSWADDLEHGFTKFPLSYYDQKVISKELDLSKEQTRKAMATSVADLRKSPDTAVRDLAPVRNSIISWVYSMPYHKVVRHVYLDTQGEVKVGKASIPNEMLALKSRGYFKCTVLEDANYQHQL